MFYGKLFSNANVWGEITVFCFSFPSNFFKNQYWRVEIYKANERSNRAKVQERVHLVVIHYSNQWHVESQMTKKRVFVS